jgi:hypothetical protein
MCKERKYEFRQLLNTVHQSDRRDYAVKPGKNETEIEDGWKIFINRNASILLEKVAMDLQNYFFTSMNVAVMLKKTDSISKITEKNSIILGTKEDMPSLGKALSIPKSYVLKCEKHMIFLCGFDDRGTAQGCYYVEDLMNLKEAPVIEIGNFKREPLFSPRMVHSGWGIDQYPDSHLNTIAHAGMDAIIVFAKDVDTTTMGYLDFNDLIDRAASFGIDVYMYSYLKSLKHPSEKDAGEYYDNTYGKLFKACPKAKGVILVGESCEFPSKDNINTTGKPWNFPDSGIRQTKPSPGWWPCYDYPEWLDIIKRTVRKYNSQADIVFWTYNWGYAPERDRIKLIDSLPKDITLLVTFEMFEQVKRDGITDVCMDYTISFPGPGEYFVSEAKAAKKKNIRLYAMSNTAGRTWDFGTVPYIPVPFQWSRRHQALHEAREKWGLCGLMESHHYGFYPSIVSELAKWSYWGTAVPTEKTMKKISEKNFGVKGSLHALKAWKLWSAAINDYIPANEDQYGPCRVGPSYPMIFHPDITRTFGTQEIAMPTSPHAHFGHKIVKTLYHPFENEQQSPGGIRFPVEIMMLEKMLNTWHNGISSMAIAVELAPEKKKIVAEKMLGIGKYIANTILTTIHMKQWWILNKKLLLETSASNSEKLLKEIEELAMSEIKNAENTIPLVEVDSRLGWEPSMEYMTDKEHLEWKIKQVKRVVEHEIPVYRKLLNQ